MSWVDEPNWWGEPDDIEPFPDWMLPPSKRQNQLLEQKRAASKSVENTIRDILQKPATPVQINEDDVRRILGEGNE